MRNPRIVPKAWRVCFSAHDIITDSVHELPILKVKASKSLGIYFDEICPGRSVYIDHLAKKMSSGLAGLKQVMKTCSLSINRESFLYLTTVMCKINRTKAFLVKQINSIIEQLGSLLKVIGKQDQLISQKC